MADMRSYVSGNFVLNLDGKSCGFLKSVAGGGAMADVVNEKIGADHFVHKHISGVKYEELEMDFSFSMTPSLFDWIAASWSANSQRKSGSILACDAGHAIKNEREFHNALITETVIPACDGASKEQGYFKLKVAPEYTRTKAGSGKTDATYSKTHDKLWCSNNFRLEIDGLDATKVNRIESFSVKQKVAVEAVGELRDYQKEPGTIEFPNLKITLSEASAQKWNDWFEDFVVKGNCGEDKEKSGTLTFLTPNLKTAVGSVKFEHLGIFKLSPEPASANSERIRRVTAELYCERMIFAVGSAKT